MTIENLVSVLVWISMNCSVYLIAGVVGLMVSVIELLSRYGSGNHPKWILCGWAQSFYYLINFFAAVAALFASEALGQTAIVKLFATDPALAIVKACGIALVGMLGLRSSLFSLDKSDDRSKIDIGPAQIINVLNRYLERQIDQKRGREALQEVAKIMKDFNPALISDLCSICLSVPESIPDQDLVKLKQQLDVLNTNPDSLSAQAKAMAMGIQIQKEVGMDTLREAVASFKDITDVKEGGPLAATTGTVIAEEMVKSNDLDRALTERQGLLQQQDGGPKS